MICGNGIKILEDTNYFVSGFDSIFLANFINEKIKGKNKICCEFCSGSGVVSIYLYSILKKENSIFKIYSFEIQEKVFKIQQDNIKLNNMENIIEVHNLDIRKNKEIYKITNQVDIVYCNPPYFKNNSIIKKEDVRMQISRYEIECNLEDVFKSANTILKDRGSLFLVHKTQRLCDLISIARKYKLEAKNIKFSCNENGEAKIVVIEYVKCGSCEVKVEVSK